MLDRLRLPVYGADDGAALRDILFTWWEQKFLGAAESGAPAIGDRRCKAARSETCPATNRARLRIEDKLPGLGRAATVPSLCPRAARRGRGAGAR